MGTWGTEPLGNDAAADLMYDIGKVAHKTIKEALDSGEPELIIAASWLFTKIGVNYLYDVNTRDEDCQALCNALGSQVLENQKWINSWFAEDDKEVIVHQAKDLLKALKEMN